MAAPIERLPVLLLTGFLGSGKTTLLARLLHDPAFASTAVLVNELGAVGIDHHLLAGASGTRVLENGCVCCSVRDDLAAVLAQLFWDRLGRRVPRFERVVIETTGLADPGPVLTALAAPGIVRERYRSAAVVCTVGAAEEGLVLTQRAEAARQVALADLVFLTKADLADAPGLAAAQTRVRELNPIAPIHAIAHGDAPAIARCTLLQLATRGRATRWVARDVVDSVRGTASAAVPRPLHAADVGTFAVEVRGSSLVALEAALHRIASEHGDALLRAKGIVQVPGETRPFVVQIVSDTLYPLEPIGAPLPEGSAGTLVFIIAGATPASRAASESAIRAALEDATAAGAQSK